jgi:curved DNA-binding protein CbpA
LADKAAIRQAYYELSRRLHPDRFFRRTTGDLAALLEQAFVGVNEAYALLSDPEQRTRFDRKNPKAGASVPAPTGVDAATSEPDGGGATHEVTLGGAGPRVTTGSTKPSPKTETKPPVRSRLRSRGIDQLRQQISQQIAKARSHAKEAERLAAESNWQAAAPEMYLASRYDPRSVEYREKAEEYDVKAKQQSASRLIQQAENAESYHNVQAAEHYYRQACALEPPLGLPFFRLAQVLRLQDGDDREILRLLRSAVNKEPDRGPYRLGLAEFYLEQGLHANARREYQTVLKRDPSNDQALVGMKKTR